MLVKTVGLRKPRWHKNIPTLLGKINLNVVIHLIKTLTLKLPKS